MNPNTELYKSLVFTIKELGIKDTALKEGLIRRAFELSGLPLSFFDDMDNLKKDIEEKRIEDEINALKNIIKIRDNELVSTVVDILKTYKEYKTSCQTDLVNSLINKAGISYRDAYIVINKAVECGAIKVIQNGKRKTFYLPED